MGLIDGKSGCNFTIMLQTGDMYSYLSTAW